MRLDIARQRPLRGRLEPPPDRTATFDAVALMLAGRGRSVVGRWRSTPESENLRTWLAESGGASESLPEGLAVSPLPSSCWDDLEVGAFVPEEFAVALVAVQAGWCAREGRPGRLHCGPSQARGVLCRAELLRAAALPVRVEKLADGGVRVEFGAVWPSPVAPITGGGVVFAAAAAGRSARWEVDDPHAPEIVLGAMGLPVVRCAAAAAATVPEEDPELARRMARRLGRTGRLAGWELASGATLVPGVLEPPADADLVLWTAVNALMRRGGDVEIVGVDLHPARSGWISALRRMGASIEVLRRREGRSGTTGDVRVLHGKLVGRSLDAARVPLLARWAPLVAAAASVAEGETVLSDLENLADPDDRREDLAALVGVLRGFGLSAGVWPEGLVLRGEDAPSAAAVDARSRPWSALAAHALASSTPGITQIEGADTLVVRWPWVLGVGGAEDP